MSKAAAIESSLRCFVCGLVALIPVVGLPFVAAAVILFSKASPGSPEAVNPARRYAVLGVTFAVVGLLVSTTATVWVAVFWLTRDG